MDSDAFKTLTKECQCLCGVTLKSEDPNIQERIHRYISMVTFGEKRQHYHVTKSFECNIKRDTRKGSKNTIPTVAFQCTDVLRAMEQDMGADIDWLYGVQSVPPSPFPPSQLMSL